MPPGRPPRHTKTGRVASAPRHRRDVRVRRVPQVEEIQLLREAQGALEEKVEQSAKDNKTLLELVQRLEGRLACLSARVDTLAAGEKSWRDGVDQRHHEFQLKLNETRRELLEVVGWEVDAVRADITRLHDASPVFVPPTPPQALPFAHTLPFPRTLQGPPNPFPQHFPPLRPPPRTSPCGVETVPQYVYPGREVLPSLFSVTNGAHLSSLPSLPTSGQPPHLTSIL